jgi:DNA polymerase-4
MPIWQARQRCPHGIFLPGNFDAYAEDGRRAVGIYQRYTPLLEPLSVDEAVLDITQSLKLFGGAKAIATDIKRRVREELELTCSIGVGPNRLIAKMASEWDKPDGLTIVAPEQLPDVLDDLPVARLWGVGPQTAERLRRLGVRTVYDLRQIPLLLLEREFGAAGRWLCNASRGIDDEPVRPYCALEPAKSMSHEITLEHDTRERELLRRALLALSERVARRLRRSDYRGRVVTLKIKFHDFKQITRSTTLQAYTNLEEVIYGAAEGMLGRLDFGAKRVRLIGVAVSQLRLGARHAQLSLFDRGWERTMALAQATDDICDRFGDRAVTRGSLVRLWPAPPPA